MFMAALFVIDRIWRQPRCPSSEEWIKKMWHIYTLEYYAEKNLEFCMQMDGVRKHYPERGNLDPKRKI